MRRSSRAESRSSRSTPLPVCHVRITHITRTDATAVAKKEREGRGGPRDEPAEEDRGDSATAATCTGVRADHTIENRFRLRARVGQNSAADRNSIPRPFPRAMTAAIGSRPAPPIASATAIGADARVTSSANVPQPGCPIPRLISESTRRTPKKNEPSTIFGRFAQPSTNSPPNTIGRSRGTPAISRTVGCRTKQVPEVHSAEPGIVSGLAVRPLLLETQHNRCCRQETW